MKQFIQNTANTAGTFLKKGTHTLKG